MKYLILLLFASGTFFTNRVAAQLRLPNFFSDHMVIQRDTSTLVWGWAKAGAEVKLIPSWNNDTSKVIATGNAKWQYKLKTGAAGGPHQLTIISLKDTLVLKDILFGEVWLCSGQSNMQWSSVNKLQEMIDILPKIKNNSIRLLNVGNVAADHPQDNLNDSWTVCDSASASTFSAIGYFYADKLHKELNVPVGIINSSWGGTCAEVWTPEELVSGDPVLHKASLAKGVAPRKPNLPGRTWNSMIYPLVGYAIKGALWYQGEDNVGTWFSYEKLMSAMIQSWRKAWNHQFPFYFAQIAPYDYKNKELPKAALLREAQTKTMLNNDNVYMVLTSDLVPDVKNIHPTRKHEVANRFADIALVKTYKTKSVNPFSPVYKSHTISGNQIVVEFYFMGNEKLSVSKNEKISELYIAGPDKKFYPAEYKISGNKLRAWSKSVPVPVALRYAFTETDLTHFKSSNGLPVGLFRTDKWNDADVKMIVR
ncbi:sialate O-acetylesterase [Pedobacter heparinus]|uniref:sialate O-acetylesterase n=1 Tax=Pedobacter heparinus TaxID=984 RepID=UPI00292D688C|nr:sialate O-acetylesterase [Pedobacter heparinus]